MRGATLLLSLTLVACENFSGTRAIYVVPEEPSALDGTAFFDHPWPADTRREGGMPRFQGFYNPRGAPIVDDYAGSMTGVVDGFSPVAPGYLRFEGPIDPSAFPADAAAEAGASVVLVDVDPDSPERGTLHPLSLQLRAEEGAYHPPNTVAFMPTLGVPLRPSTTYALVVTRDVLDAEGAHVQPSKDLEAALGLSSSEEPRLAAEQDALAPALAELAPLGIDASDVASLAVFTTADPTAELYAVQQHLRAEYPAPAPDAGKWELKQKGSWYDEYLGEYGPSPNYQVGNLPFANEGDGGGFVFVDGVPQIGSEFSLRFSLTVPKESDCPMPANGYPIVLYGHGTGGSYRSYVNDGTARALAEQCLAAMGIDGLYHGTRPGTPATEAEIELLFFNFENPIAGRTGVRQEAIDHLQRARLFTETQMVVPSVVSETGADIKFDPEKVMFFGHSQGALTGALYLPADDSSIGAVLSGSSSVMLITLLEKTQPEPSIPALVANIFLQLAPEEMGELDIFHPALSLVQTFIDVSDPIHYARDTILTPRAGFAPKSIYQTVGVNPDGTGDSYAPPHGAEALGCAMGLPLVTPVQRLSTEAQLGLVKQVGLPLEGNLANGLATGGQVQWAVPPGSDGHFVVFDVDAARLQAAAFLRSVADGVPGKIQ